MSLKCTLFNSIFLDLKTIFKCFSKVGLGLTVHQPRLVYFGLVAQPWMLDRPLAPRHHAASEAAAYHCSKVTQPVNSVNTVYLLSEPWPPVCSLASAASSRPWPCILCCRSHALRVQEESSFPALTYRLVL